LNEHGFPLGLSGNGGNAISKRAPSGEKPRNEKRKDDQCSQNNLYIESPHSTVVRLRPTNLSALRRSASHRADQSIGFHASILSELKTLTKGHISFVKDKIISSDKNAEKCS
jgi:hypothetical protein